MNAEVKEMIKRFTAMQRWKLIAKNEHKECKNTHTKIAWWMSSAFEEYNFGKTKSGLSKHILQVP